LFGFTGLGINPPRRAGCKETIVKANIHPMYRKVMVQCACGNHFETRSTSTNVHVEICAKCHPYYTGKQRLVDTQGRVDRFRKKYAADKTTSGTTQG
jgi:large subunit ribosomal protein L31